MWIPCLLFSFIRTFKSFLPFLSLLHQASRRTTVHIVLMSLLCTFVSCLLMQEKKIPGSLWGYLVFSLAVKFHLNLPFSSSSSLQKNFSAHYPYELALNLLHLLTDAREEDTNQGVYVDTLSSLQLYTGIQSFSSLLHQASSRTSVHNILMSFSGTFFTCLQMQEKKIQRSLWGYLVFSTAVYWHTKLLFSSSSSLH